MFATIIEIEHVLDMIKSYQLNEQQINKLLSYIKENPTISVPKLIEIVDDIQDGKYVLLNAGEFSLDPILNESKTVNLMQITLPIITKHIPKEILGYLTEVHVRYIVDKILDVDFIPGDDNVLDLRNRIDEMFMSGDITIPLQGLRKEPNSIDVVINGIFAPMLYKGIQFDLNMYSEPFKSYSKNKKTLRYALKDYNDSNNYDAPMLRLLPKFIIVLKDLLNGEIK